MSTVTFRHEMPQDGSEIEIPKNVQFEHITMEIDDAGRPHLMWFEKDSVSIPPSDI